MIAALFVRKTSHYKKMTGVDCYDVERNALTWRGGAPGVYHPPCRSWGKLSHFAKPRAGERELALWSMAMVRRFGGVVEHPQSSRLWAESNCIGYGLRDGFGGVLVPVFQSWFGHRAEKRTCLYIVGPVPDLSLIEPDQHLVTGTIENMGRPEREATPPAFAQFLVNLARSCVSAS